MKRWSRWWIGLLALSIACGEDADPPADASGRVDAGHDAGPLPVPAADYLSAGPYPVGNVHGTWIDASRESREIPVEIWYPAAESAREAASAGQPMEAFERGANRDQLAALIASAPSSCIRAQTRSADAPEPIAEPARWPIVVFSHCHACTRFDLAEVSERLASFGIAVVAPDHTGNALWDELAGTAAPVGPDFLEVRVADLRFVLDEVLDETGSSVPERLRGRFDPERVGVMGHSFGAATAGVAAARDPRIRAGLAIAAPISALGGVRANMLETPFGFVVAREDNSIREVGNTLMRREAEQLAGPSWRVEVRDAGHWSFSDHCGLIDLFMPGCGSGTRQTEPGVGFEYLDNAVARDVAADVAAAFFARWLLGDVGATTALVWPHSSGAIELTYRP